MSIYTYIEEQEEGFKKQIPLEEGWNWNFPDHVSRSFLYKNSQFERNNEDRENRPFKNIIRPILNIHYRIEGFDVKDIDIYVDDPSKYYKSFVLKKFHEKWAVKNGIDTFIDELVESYVDYGGVLVKNTKSVRPEVIDLRTMAFCDQTDIMSGPFAIKHYLSVSQLRAMADKGWDADMIEYLILKSEAKKETYNENTTTKTPGRYVELYEVHNVTPMDVDPLSQESDTMMYVCGLYKSEDDRTEGITLFEKRVPDIDKLFKFLKRDPIQGRALGFGGIEELFEPQVWTNFAEIHIAGMLEHASKVWYKSTDPKFKGQNTKNKDNGHIFDLSPNTDFSQVDNAPRNITAFTNYTTEMHEHASEIGAASDVFLGQQPNAGTPFKSVEQQLVEGKSLHLWRQGRIASFVHSLYMDWFLPALVKDATNGDKFMAELSASELMMVASLVAKNGANKKLKMKILDFEKPLPSEEEYTTLRQTLEQDYLQSGPKKFFELLKDEMSKEKLGVSVNIVGKQKNLAQMTDKLVNVIRQYLATPEIRQDPEMVKMLNEVLESSGLSPLSFGPKLVPTQQQGNASTEGLKQLAESNQPENAKA